MIPLLLGFWGQGTRFWCYFFLYPFVNFDSIWQYSLIWPQNYLWVTLKGSLDIKSNKMVSFMILALFIYFFYLYFYYIYGKLSYKIRRKNCLLDVNYFFTVIRAIIHLYYVKILLSCIIYNWRYATIGIQPQMY